MNCDYLKLFGKCTDSCVAFKITCSDIAGDRTFRNAIRDVLIILIVVAALAALVFGGR